MKNNNFTPAQKTNCQNSGFNIENQDEEKFIYGYEKQINGKWESADTPTIKIGDTKSSNIEKYIEDSVNARNSTNPIKWRFSFSPVLAQYVDGGNIGEYFRDHDLRKTIEILGFPRLKNEQGSPTEEHRIKPEVAEYIISKFINGIPSHQMDIKRIKSFKMRPEQETAVILTQKYFKKVNPNRISKSKPTDMMWNAKMRFGKTFSAYQLMLAEDYKNTLIITYKPAVKGQWRDDLNTHKDFNEYTFLENSNKSYSLKTELEKSDPDKKLVVFLSYQDLLHQNKENTKHENIYNIDWDLIIIDEFHYGTSTDLAEDLFNNKDKPLSTKDKQELITASELIEGSKLKTKFRLFLSGTPFKALSSNKYLPEQIFNWTYIDEQKSKDLWTEGKRLEIIQKTLYSNKTKEEMDNINLFQQNTANPYQKLPEIMLYVYKISKKIVDDGALNDKNEFALNYFFKAKELDGEYIFFKEIKTNDNKKATKNQDKNITHWLDQISAYGIESTTNQEKLAIQAEDEDYFKEYGKDREVITSQQPFENSPFNQNNILAKSLKHTLWYLPNVASVLALEKLLIKHPIFSKYWILPIVGKKSRIFNKKVKAGSGALEHVDDAMDSYESKGKIGTITLTVGMLTTGVSVPQWNAVLFLRDIKTPESYFQTAFRVQTPHTEMVDGREEILKKRCYVFDFSPTRSLRLLSQYSDKLSGENKGLRKSTQESVTEFIKYLQVMEMSGNKMIKLNAKDVLKYDYKGLSAAQIGQGFTDNKNVKIDDETMEFYINEDNVHYDKLKTILAQIKKFAAFNKSSGKVDSKIDVDMDRLNKNNQDTAENHTKKITKLEDGDDITAEEQKEKKLFAEKKKQKKKLQDLLKTLLSRIPLYMILTDISEEDLSDIVYDTVDDEDNWGDLSNQVEIERDLFKKATGITKLEFIFLMDIGFISLDSIEGYIQKFKELEDDSYKTSNSVLNIPT